jgi:hypothetical protein
MKSIPGCFTHQNGLVRLYTWSSNLWRILSEFGNCEYFIAILTLQEKLDRVKAAWHNLHFHNKELTHY